MPSLVVRLRAVASDDRGSTPAEFALVGLLLTVLTLAVLQLGLSVYVRNVVHDAAVDGAYHAALADSTLDEGARRTRDVVTRTVGAQFAEDVSARESRELGYATAVVTVRATLPLVGLLGIEGGMEVTAHAPLESFD